MHKNGCGRGNGLIGERGGATVLRRMRIRCSSLAGGGSGSARARTHSYTHFIDRRRDRSWSCDVGYGDNYKSNIFMVYVSDSNILKTLSQGRAKSSSRRA